MRILIADDHVVLRNTIKILLLEHYPTAVIDEVPDALGLLKRSTENVWDLIISDISMPPGLTGLDVLPEIKRHNPQTPVIILSMHSEEAYAARAIDLGASFYLNKSSVAYDLVGLVDQAVCLYGNSLNTKIKTRMQIAFS